MTITVPRPRLNWRERLYLPGIAAGLAITFKHFKNMLFGRTKVTMQYPEQKWDSHLPDYYRGAPALVRDADGRVRLVVGAEPIYVSGVSGEVLVEPVERAPKAPANLKIQDRP